MGPITKEEFQKTIRTIHTVWKEQLRALEDTMATEMLAVIKEHDPRLYKLCIERDKMTMLHLRQAIEYVEKVAPTLRPN